MQKEDILKTYGLEHFTDELKTNFSEWLTGEDGADKDIVQAREQAVQAYPTLAYDIYTQSNIRKDVDKKKPLAPALARYYQVDEKILKRVQGKTRHDLGMQSFSRSIEYIFAMKESHFQQLKDNLSDLKILHDYSNWVYDLSFFKFLDYLSLEGQNPCQHIERMKENSIPNICDALHFLREKLFIPVILNKVKNHAEIHDLTWADVITYEKIFFKSLRMLEKYTNIKTILDFSERYHRNLFRWQDMFGFDSGLKDISWQPMFGHIDCGNGWAAREIHSISKLKEQGRRENHCVGGYAGSILDGDKGSARLIFSLEKDGKIKSTIDMKCSRSKVKTKLNAKINQNCAHNNKNPCSETLDFSNLLVKKIKNEYPSKIDTYLHNLKTAREEYEKYKKKNQYLDDCGYNPWDREILENIWDEFKVVLPPRTRRLGLDGLIDMMPIKDICFLRKEKYNDANLWEKISHKWPHQIGRDEGDLEIQI